jgi:peptide/nickel transport system substrate-binding protein
MVNVRAVFVVVFLSLAILLAGSRIFADRPATGSGTANPWTIHGVVRIGSQQRPDTLGPMLGEQYIDQDLSLLWAAYLLVWNDRDEFVPELATSVPTIANGGISKDGLAITYHLRKGVEWQDGMPFTSRDVIFSWRAALNPANYVGTRIGYDQIKSIDAPDRYTVVVHLRRRFAPFVGTFFSMASEAVPLMPEHLLGRLDRVRNIPLPIGTGPFRVVSNHDGKMRFMANPHYWRGAPHLKEVDFEWLADDRSLVAALKGHRIDVYLEGAQVLEPQLRGNRGFTVYLYPFTRFADVGFNISRPQLRDKRVRQALAYGMNRTRLIDEITNGVNLPADSDQPLFGWAHYDAVRQYHYDPRRAEKMLDEEGWHIGGDGIRHKGGHAMNLRMIGQAGTATDEAAEIEIQREWRQIGVNVTIANYSTDELYAGQQDGGIQQNGRFDVTVEEWGNGVDPDDSQIFLCRMAPPVGWNIYHYCNPALDAAEAKAQYDYNRTARKADYARVQSILAEDLPLLPLWFVQREDVVNIDLQNYKPAHIATSFWNSWQWSI